MTAHRNAASRARQHAHDARLREANSRLVVAALEAQTRAEAAAEALARLMHSGRRDPLTGAPDRGLLLDRMEAALAAAARHRAHLAVLFIDLDHFKRINDNHGHAAGDAVLVAVARQLEAVVRAADTVSRYSGDEFVVLLPEIAAPRDAGVVARAIRRAIAAIDEPAIAPARLSASVGVAVYPRDGDDAATLLRHADSAMYRAKTARDQRPARHGTREALARAERRHESDLARLALVAHELRNPLLPMRMAVASLLRGNPAAPERRRRLEMLDTQLGGFARIIDDLRNDCDAVAGRLRLRLARTDLSRVLSGTLDAFAPAFDARGQIVRAELPDGALPVRGDPMRLGQIFGNLLGNAAKYTPPGGEIRLAAVIHDGRVTVTVADNGAGIAADLLPHVFELYVRARRDVPPTVEGLGIGLAVVRELVAAHGGEVSAHSDGPGRGSRFDVTLPLAASPD